MKPKKKSNFKSKNDILSLLPLLFIIAVVPMIIYMKVDNPENEIIRTYWMSTSIIDLFTYYKSMWLIAISSIGLVIFMKKYYQGNLSVKKSKYYIFIILYVLLVIASSLLSKYTSISFIGIAGRYEGMFVLISYMVIMFLAINIVNNEKHIKYILLSLFASAIVISIIGIFQYYGFDYLKSNFFIDLVTPSKYQNLDIKLPYAVGEIYTTLAHNNYVGSYMSILAPLTFVLFITVEKKKDKILLGFLSLFMFSILLGSHSRAGFVGTIIAITISIIIMRKKIIKNYVYLISGIIALTVVFSVLDIARGGIIKGYIKSLYKEATTVITDNGSDVLRDIKIDKNMLIFSFVDKELKVVLEDFNLVFRDGNDKDVNISAEGNKIKLNDERFNRINFEYGSNKNINLLHTKINGNQLIFALFKDGFKFVTHKGNIIDLGTINKWGFEGKENIGSARGYIWSRSIPLLKNTLILGYGPDTYPIYFPQDDYIGKFVNYGVINMFVDKPHNLYLNIALSTGVISLLALLIIFGMYFYTSIKTLFRAKFDDVYSQAGLGIFSAFCGYLGSGVFNDSVVPVAPVFWILLGTGISINMTLAKTMSKDNSTNKEISA